MTQTQNQPAMLIPNGAATYLCGGLRTLIPAELQRVIADLERRTTAMRHERDAARLVADAAVLTEHQSINALVLERRAHQATKDALRDECYRHDVLNARVNLDFGPPDTPSDWLQPDADTPGLYVQCRNLEQRKAIMQALAAFQDPDAAHARDPALLIAFQDPDDFIPDDIPATRPTMPSNALRQPRRTGWQAVR